jgi:hypothetical protein
MLGKLFPIEAGQPSADAGPLAPAFLHPEAFARQRTTGPNRLRIGGGRDSPRLLGTLASLLSEPLFVLVVLKVSRTHTGPGLGRYEAVPRSYVQVLDFLDEYHDLFAYDARAEVWVGSTGNSDLLVLDEHDLIYAYGNLDTFERELEAQRFRREDVEIPYPHTHWYRGEFDALEAELCDRLDWNRVLPLQESDYE